jgi:Uncharacterized conserved protein, contains double-stranded beta-helix domain
MKTIKHLKAAEIQRENKNDYPNYGFERRAFLRPGEAQQCNVAVYEILPGKAAFPYHYHVKNEEVYYILSGEGVLKTPEGERRVAAGELLYFPADEKGAHKLTNVHPTDKLIYIDFDTHNDLEVAVYPDSGKIGIWGMDIDKLYRVKDSVDYFEGE